MHDLVINNARLCTGDGTPLREGSVAVDGETISAVDSGRLHGRVEVDANALVLSPGFIDVHTHYDAQITWDSSVTPSPQMGVTTIVIGNCGFGIAPCRAEDRDLTLRSLTKVEGMPLEALLTGVEWNFETFGEYLSAIDARGVVPNVAAFVGHGCIRTFVMREDSTRREATTDELEQMKSVFARALADGAIGIGTSTAESHNGAGGIPVPSRFAAEDEFMAFSEVMRDTSKGVWQITKGALPEISFLEQLALTAGRPMQVCAMLQDPGQPELVFDDMAQISAAASRGGELWGQVSPFPEILEFDLREPYPLESIKAWAPAMQAGDDEARRAVYADEDFRAAVRNELKTPGGPFRFSKQWNTMTVIDIDNDDVRGRTIAEVADERGIPPLDCLLDLGLQFGFGIRLRCELFNADEPAVAKLLSHDNATLGLGDAGAHLTFFCQAGTGLYLLQRYVRERGALSLEHAVQLMTSRPADALRIPNRGRLAVGNQADLFLFDPATVGIGERCWVNDLPAGLSRIHTPPHGVHGVWVNGQRIVDSDGLLADAPRAGTVLREFAS